MQLGTGCGSMQAAQVAGCCSQLLPNELEHVPLDGAPQLHTLRPLLQEHPPMNQQKAKLWLPTS